MPARRSRRHHEAPRRGRVSWGQRDCHAGRKNGVPYSQLPFSHAELVAAPSRPIALADAVFRGGYSPLFDADRRLEPTRWLEDYIATFINRDVRSVLAVRDRSAFDRFFRLCAANTGQMFESARLGHDLGIDGKTVSQWVSVLEACYLVRLLRPHYRNFGKRLTKRPKLYFLDSGLACRLLHISDVNQLRGHPQWGALVETWCVSEVIKARLNRGLSPDCWFWRSSDGYEVDLVIESGNRLLPIEIKATATPYPKHAATLRKLRELADRDPSVTVPPGIIIYGGDEARPCGEDSFVPWRAIDAAVDALVPASVVAPPRSSPEPDRAAEEPRGDASPNEGRNSPNRAPG